eukprot:2837365-Ditylum_brightwellii.AAC.1
MGDDLASLVQAGDTTHFHLTPKTRCLALLKGNKAGTLCKGSADCKILGHAQSRESNPPKAGFYIVVLDEEGPNIKMIFTKGFEEEKSRQERVERDLEGEKKMSA